MIKLPIDEDNGFIDETGIYYDIDNGSLKKLYLLLSTLDIGSLCFNLYDTNIIKSFFDFNFYSFY